MMRDGEGGICAEGADKRRQRHQTAIVHVPHAEKNGHEKSEHGDRLHRSP